MCTDAYKEDFMPELSAAERRLVHVAARTVDPWRRMYSGTESKDVRRRIEISYAVATFAGKRNMWTFREEREKIEERMSVEDCDYLSRVWPNEIGRERFREQLLRKRLSALRTDRQFAELVARLPVDDRDIVQQTMQAISDADFPPYLNRDAIWDALCGNFSAQALIGDCFLHGHGVFRVVEIARFWLQKAAPYDETARDLFAELKAEGLA